MRINDRLRQWAFLGIILWGASNPVRAQRVGTSPPNNLESSSPRIVARLGLARADKPQEAAHAGPVTKLTFSPDGRLLASASEDSSVCLWNINTGELLAKREGDATGDLRFSPDGWLLGAAGRQGNYRLWEVSSGDLLMEGDPIRNLAATAESRFSPELNLLAMGSSQGQVHLIETITGKSLPDLEVFPQTEIGSLAFSPDGRWLAVGSGLTRNRNSFRGSVAIWDVAKNQKLRELKSPVPEEERSYSQRYDSLEFSPDGGTLAARHSRRGLEFWNPVKGTRTLGLPNLRGRPMVFSRIGRVLALLGVPGSRVPPAQHFELQLMEVITGSIFQSWQVPNRTSAFALSPDGELLAVSSRTSRQILLMSLESSSDPSPTEQALKKAVDRLADHDASNARKGMATLIAAGDRAIPLLSAHLKTAAEPVQRDKQMDHLIQDLDDDDFFVREKAMAKLAELGASAVPAMKAALENAPSFEAASRMRALLKRAEGSPKRIPGGLLRRLRAVEILERIPTSQSKDLLKSLADGPEDSPVATAARLALKRIPLSPTER